MSAKARTKTKGALAPIDPEVKVPRQRRLNRERLSLSRPLALLVSFSPSCTICVTGRG